MRRCWVRIGVVIVTVATLVFAGHRIRLSELTLDDEQNVERVFTDLSWTLTRTIGELSAAQQALVAAGQNRAYWTDQVNSHLQTVDSSLDNLRQLASSQTSIEALESAGGVVADLTRINSRALVQVNLNQSLLASDLLFSDGLELATRAITHVELARATERTTHTDAIRAARGSQTMMLWTSAGVSVLGLLLLVGTRRDAGQPPFELTDQGDGSAPDEAADRDGSDVRRNVQATSADSIAVDAAPSPAKNIHDRLLDATSDRLLDATSDRLLDATSDRLLDATSDRLLDATSDRLLDATSDRLLDATSDRLLDATSDRLLDATPVPDLRAAANLCTDFAKLTDTRDLPSLLARATALMNASGLILWVRDPSGQTLRPAAGHGYSSRVLARLGTISKDGNNATAAAYRHARMQVVDHDDMAVGALAVPLISADSCVGVLSVELRNGWETSETVQATAAIIGAQLAVLLTVEPTDTTAATATAAHG
jgi:hypothetical protein